MCAVRSRRIATPKFSSSVKVIGFRTMASETWMGFPEAAPTAPIPTAQVVRRARMEVGARRWSARLPAFSVESIGALRGGRDGGASNEPFLSLSSGVAVAARRRDGVGGGGAGAGGARRPHPAAEAGEVHSLALNL